MDFFLRAPNWFQINLRFWSLRADENYFVFFGSSCDLISNGILIVQSVRMSTGIFLSLPDQNTVLWKFSDLNRNLGWPQMEFLSSSRCVSTKIFFVFFMSEKGFMVYFSCLEQISGWLPGFNVWVSMKTILTFSDRITFRRNEFWVQSKSIFWF